MNGRMFGSAVLCAAACRSVIGLDDIGVDPAENGEEAHVSETGGHAGIPDVAGGATDADAGGENDTLNTPASGANGGAGSDAGRPSFNAGERGFIDGEAGAAHDGGSTDGHGGFTHDAGGAAPGAGFSGGGGTPGGTAAGVGGRGGEPGDAGTAAGVGGAWSGTSTALDDEFDSARTFADQLLSGQWRAHKNVAPWLVSSDIDEAAGVLRLVPQARSENGWFQTFTGPMYYRALEGDFVVETQVQTSDPSDPSRAAPGAIWSGGGLLVMDSVAPFGSTFYQVSVGTLGMRDLIGIRSEVRPADPTTHRRISRLAASARLRICRVGETLQTLYAPYGTADWQVFEYALGSSNAPALSASVYVGIIVNEGLYAASPHTQVEFDHFRVNREIGDLADCR